MTRRVETILKDALELPTEEREEIAAEILASLDADAFEDAEHGWATEIEKRVRRVLSTEVAGRPWSEVRERIRREVLGR